MGRSLPRSLRSLPPRRRLRRDPRRAGHAITDVDSEGGLFDELEGTVHDLLLLDVDCGGAALANDSDSGLVERVRITGTVSHPNYAAGFIRTNRGSLVDCHSEVTVQSAGDAGGLVWRHSSGSIRRCNVVANISGYSKAGGLVVDDWDGSIRMSCTDVVVTSQTGTGSAFVAEAEPRPLFSTQPPQVTDCHPGGTVSAVDGAGPTGRVVMDFMPFEVERSHSNANLLAIPFGSRARLIGSRNGTGDFRVEDCHFEIDGAGTSASSGGVAHWHDEMVLQATCENWDFATTWSIEEGLAPPRLDWTLP